MTENMIIVGDGHFHIYPCFNLARLFSVLIRNLDDLVEDMLFSSKPSRRVGHFQACPPQARENGNPDIFSEPGFPIAPSNIRASGMTINNQEQTIFRMACLAESGNNDFFHSLAGRDFNGFQVAEGPEKNCRGVKRDGKEELCLLAGRQIVTKEKLEILGIGIEEKIADGCSAEGLIELIINKGGIPVLPFSPGKWFFERGKIACKLVERYSKTLVIGDSFLRPRGWPEPRIMRLTGENILPGSDPLPMPGEEKYAGRCGFVYRGTFDRKRPLAMLKEILASHPSQIMPAGRRGSPLNVAIRLIRLRKKNVR
jgi:hypothetical protein